VVPGISRVVSSAGGLLIIAIVGTTVAPLQLFFQQSNIVDKASRPRFISYERATRHRVFRVSSSWRRPYDHGRLPHGAPGVRAP